MINYKLIKLTEGYIIVSNEDIKEDDWYYYIKCILKFKSFPQDKGRTPKNSDGSQKIIASNFIPELPNIDFNNLEEEFGIVDVEKLAYIKYPKIKTYLGNEEWNNDGNGNPLKREGFIEGFNKCLELNKDKLYTLEDMEYCYNTANRRAIMQEAGLEANLGFKDYMDKYHNTKNGWSIEIEMHSCPENIGVCGLGCIGKCNSRITDNSIKITKIL